MRRTRGTGETPQDVEREVAPGDNSKKAGFADEALLSYVERIERLDEEIKALGEDRTEVYTEAKGTGFDPKILRMVIRLRKMEAGDRKEQEALLELYMEAVTRAMSKQTATSIEEGA